MQYYGRGQSEFHAPYDWREWAHVSGAMQTCHKSGDMSIVTALLIGVTSVGILGIFILLCSLCSSKFCCKVDDLTAADSAQRQGKGQEESGQQVMNERTPLSSPVSAARKLGSRERLLKESISISRSYKQMGRLKRTKKAKNPDFDYVRMDV